MSRDVIEMIDEYKWVLCTKVENYSDIAVSKAREKENDRVVDTEKDKKCASRMKSAAKHYLCVDAMSHHHHQFNNKTMDAEQLRDYCLSLSPDVVEKMPFTHFKWAANVLAFYIGEHIFCCFDVNDLSRVTMKGDADEIIDLKDRYDCVDRPFNGNARYWFGLDVTRAAPLLTRRLIAESFEIVRKRK